MKKELILLVGMQGCGKSTFAQNYQRKYKSKNFKILSQDSTYKKSFFETFKDSIKNEDNIIIDRTNKTQLERSKFISYAKKYNYFIRIINLNLPLKICAQRLIQRTQSQKHPTFNPKDYKEATKVLYLFIKEYEPPTEEECDVLENPTSFDPYCLDLSQKYTQFLIIGDIHGCYDELQLLLNSYKVRSFLSKNKTAIVCVGDLIDKGPKSKEVLDWFFSQEDCYCVRGNHEFKLQRYLRGNNITISHGLGSTLEQAKLNKKSENFNSKYAQFILEELDSLPFMIKISQDSYIIHAGLHPQKPMFKQPKEYLLFARTFNPITHSFNTPGDANWFEYYEKKDKTIFFGHQYHEKIPVKENIFSLDGFCVFGKELRAALISTKNQHIKSKEFVSIPALKTYYKEEDFSHHGIIEHLKFLSDKGYINSSKKENLILYNYTQKTIYEKKWDAFTMQARGIIFDYSSRLIVARPFGKFFNINETTQTQLLNLPNEEFEVFEKLDGSLGIIFYYNSQWHITTRGQFDSIQAKIGKELLHSEVNTQKLNPQYTYLCEIIHPKCKNIIDYKDRKELVLIGMIHTQNGEEVAYPKLKEEAQKAGFSVMKKITQYLSIKELLEDSKNWPSSFEGVVIRFNSGLRVKVKSKAFMSTTQVYLHLDIKHLLEFINYNGKVDFSVVENAPEELVETIKKDSKTVEELYQIIKKEIYSETQKLIHNIDSKVDLDFNNSKQLITFLNAHNTRIGEIIYENNISSNITFTHKKAILFVLKSQEKNLHNYILKEMKKRIK